MNVTGGKGKVREGEEEATEGKGSQQKVRGR